MIFCAISPCPNDTFIFDALIHKKIAFSHDLQPHFYDIEQLNTFALQKRFDLIKVSTAILHKIQDEYQLLTAGSAVGRGCGPQLISKNKSKIQSSSSIAIPGPHTTAKLLFDLFYPESKNQIFMPYHTIFDAVMNDEVDAGLLIHEARFIADNLPLCLQLDLGKLFEERFQCMVPLGVIVARRSLGKEVINELEQAIAASIQFARHHPESSQAFITQHAQEKDPVIIQKHIDLYVTSDSLSLSKEALYSIEILLQNAGEQR